MTSVAKSGRRRLTVREAVRPMYSTAATAFTAEEEGIIRDALNIIESKLHRTNVLLESPKATRDYIALQMGGLQHEVFGILLLDNRHRLIATEFLFRGTIDGASCHPREILKVALAHNAAAVILFHGHPSGQAEQSQADELISLRIRDCLALAEIRVLDHLIAGGSRCVSLAERGIL